MNVTNIVRGAFQSAFCGYWAYAGGEGRGLMTDGLRTVVRHAMSELGLHRLQIAIIPRNAPSRGVVAKLGLRDEGVAVRYLEINGTWEDHIRYAITVEEWQARREELLQAWVLPEP